MLDWFHSLYVSPFDKQTMKRSITNHKKQWVRRFLFSLTHHYHHHFVVSVTCRAVSFVLLAKLIRSRMVSGNIHWCSTIDVNRGKSKGKKFSKIRSDFFRTFFFVFNENCSFSFFRAREYYWWLNPTIHELICWIFTFLPDVSHHTHTHTHLLGDVFVVLMTCTNHVRWFSPLINPTICLY